MTELISIISIMKRFYLQCHNLIYGVAVGDAMGFPMQFYKREQVKKFNIPKMTAHHSGQIPAGTWSDDTSLTVALADALCNSDEIDYEKIMGNFYLWISEGKFSPYYKAFDIGRTCFKALMCYSGGDEPLLFGCDSEMDNGNGSLMRISPLVFYINKLFGEDAFDNKKTFEIIHNVSRLTHAHQIALIACDIYVAVLFYLYKGKEKNLSVKTALNKVQRFVNKNRDFEYGFSKFQRLYDDNFSSLPENKISSKGYVVDTLEAALWCFLSTGSYRECILKAINLGNDTDTIGAVAGAMAGLYYAGQEDKDIPEDWIKDLQGKDLLDKTILKLVNKYEL